MVENITKNLKAVVSIAGKQYVVKEGDVIRTERLNEDLGENITFKDVLLVLGGEGELLSLGNPMCDATINGVVIEEIRGKKIVVQKFKSKVRYRKKIGHRQTYSTVKIGKINFNAS